MTGSSEISQRWWHRLLHVVYTILLLGSLAIAVSLCVSILWPDTEVERSAVFYITAAWIFGITLFFEVLRRTAAYITAGKAFFAVSLPLHIKLLTATALLTLFASGVAYRLVDVPKNKAQELEYAKWYAQSRDKLAAAEATLAACMGRSVAEKDAATAEVIAECERKKNIQRGLYNDCRADGYSSHAFCISLYDYQGIKCEGMSLGSYANFAFQTSCRAERDEVHIIKKFISEYEALH